MTPEIKALYQSIGAELASVPSEEFDRMVLYAEGEDGVMSADVYYVVPQGKELIYLFGGDTLTSLLFELWERWSAVPGQEPWRALLYSVRDRKFEIKLTYAGDFEANRDAEERRLAAVRPILGPYPANYSRMK